MATQTNLYSAGSAPKDWDLEELKRCGAIGTGIRSPPNLQGEIHPVFHNWVIPNSPGDAEALGLELRQPLLLASRILEQAGLRWLSEFVIDDIFSSTYPGQHLSPPYYNIKGDEEFRWQTQTTPDVIVRHHSAPWKTSHIAQRWLTSTAYLLRTQLPGYVEWQLDPDIFSTFGWVGYTCRHRHRPQGTTRTWLEAVGMDNDTDTDGPLDHPDTIRTADQKAQKRGAKGRPITVLVMIELGHVIYWRDFRAINRRMTEPYFGGDLEMELGDSFVASIFSGWIPVPVDIEGDVAALFDNRNWAVTTRAEDLIRPSTLSVPYSVRCENVDIDASVSHAGLHASAAIADFLEGDEGGKLCCRWKRKPGTDFRIPMYKEAVISREGEGGSGSPDGFRMVPDEPSVRGKVVAQVKITLEFPSSVISHPRPHQGDDGRAQPMAFPDGFVLRIGEGGACGRLDLRRITCDGLRRRIAKVLSLPKENVKLHLRRGEGGTKDEETEIFGPALLSAYARVPEGDGLALSLSLNPD
ncbi:hypothetical protein B0H67DRAFT_644678 [Lasiosphaeris hirsuta]|uniref:Uncharacterized protein n=1 Tax=Lasiosphaeris hirsuta TaxID=260670 RepID=A0AA40DST0_9PEZI|nr:hypothetical protein B0H67DRAFT_644678 [Lasiosphaeris hirsuta]